MALIKRLMVVIANLACLGIYVNFGGVSSECNSHVHCKGFIIFGQISSHRESQGSCFYAWFLGHTFGFYKSFRMLNACKRCVRNMCETCPECSRDGSVQAQNLVIKLQLSCTIRLQKECKRDLKWNRTIKG